MKSVVWTMLLFCGAATAQQPWQSDYARACDLAGQAKTEAALTELDNAFAKGLEDVQRVLLDPRLQSLHGERRFRAMLRAHCKAEPLTLVAEDEPGVRIVLRGQILGTDGKPAVGALVYAFHADDDPEVADVSPDDELHLPIFGYVRTNEHGKIELRTIMPGAYPEREDAEGAARYVPRHVNLEVINWTGVTTRAQIVFDDDPRLSHPHWQDLAKQGGHPVAKVQRQKNGNVIAQFELRLKG